jgi:hypothetical protein
MRVREPVVLLVAVALAACDKPAEKPATPSTPHAHSHGDAPHGGEVVELGEEEAHLGMIHDHTGGNVTVYVLDKDVKTPIRVATPTIVISTPSGPKEFALTAVNPEKDGTADTWKGSHEGLKSDPWNGRIRITVRGKAYQAPLEPSEHK